MIDNILFTFVKMAIRKQYINHLDEIVVTNALLHALHKEDFNPTEEIKDSSLSLLDLKETLVEYALKQRIIEDSTSQKEQFGAYIMSFITPLPSVLNTTFWEKYAYNPQEATDYFYTLSQENDYIKTKDIAKNQQFFYDGKYGTLHITINLSKPEKDPKDIVLASQHQSVNYPVSQLTMTNEGYYGRINHPARSQHRLVRVNVNGENWGLQYSPYAYFNEHCIFLSQDVRPMHIDRACFSNLLHLVRQFPHYFVGSNAGLPIVGGSILSHDHYQAGRFTFPMELASIDYSVEIKGVKVSVLNWPMTTLRLESANKDTLLDVAEHILSRWKNYTNEDLHILSHTHGEMHNTITPIARLKENIYELDLVLRNNRTSEQYPDGIFHPHPEVQHIKKENIGLIEVMGLAILPPRLKSELQEVEEYLLGKQTQVAAIHQEWAEHLAKGTDRLSVRQEIERGVGEVFEKVLEHAGVFKRDEQGQRALKDFVESLKW
ncbi:MULTISPECIES: UDP-glucose--hexose-1-phosphate uridylyltransferase [unclassified Granulicatella]|uniref:UDP-glucose--hexose-1-phosphate uridylyltransferase n=1 Tax=unclassified Granulicatella TaxID=2630493 RepID=UPI0010748B63|nr:MULTISPECIES: UDP-glucose--hexose-1-phosphate uridylyltransferase [unclassified Granulicatella]MBF0780586.1 UDP-glucose--hexose-1-phosphate uridylyltransferase [Granulicatella sp. 19428wC4_WM01]TFU94895.1 UDP-glucose--hexose-1-phosphate uridylyltransferase [Granulicatella sp. WM01]